MLQANPLKYVARRNDEADASLIWPLPWQGHRGLQFMYKGTVPDDVDDEAVLFTHKWTTCNGECQRPPR